MEKIVVIFQPGEVWKKIFWAITKKKANNFPDLYFIWIFLIRLIILFSSF